MATPVSGHQTSVSPVQITRNRLYGLRKEDRLRLRSLVSGLFDGGNSLSAFPLRMVWRKWTADEIGRTFRRGIPEGIGRLQMMITVPKRKRRHAVDRVLMRRRIREAYRLLRPDVEERIMQAPDFATLSVAFIYMSERNHSFSKIHSRMASLLEKLAQEVNPEPSSTESEVL